MLGEHEAQSGEAASRAFLDLPEGQQKFFDAVAERTSHIVAVIMSGRPLDIRKIAEKSQAVLLAWRPGTMGAEAVVRLVYGEETPSGKLSVSIPWSVGQVPVSYWDVKTGHRMTEGRIRKTALRAGIWIFRISRFIRLDLVSLTQDLPLHLLYLRNRREKIRSEYYVR